MQNTFSFELINEISEISRIGNLIDEFGEKYALDFKTINSLNFILDEILTNIISYAFEDKNIHKIYVRLVSESDYILIETTDDGKYFDPTKAEEVDVNKELKDREIGGLGIHLVKNLSNEMIYERIDDKNILVVKLKKGK